MRSYKAAVLMWVLLLGCTEGRGLQDRAVAQGATEPHPHTVRLSVRSDPTGATVALAGIDVGRTPLEQDIPYATEPVQVEVRCDGCDPWTDTVVPRASQLVDLTLRVNTPPATAVAHSPGPSPGEKAAESAMATSSPPNKARPPTPFRKNQPKARTPVTQPVAPAEPSFTLFD